MKLFACLLTLASLTSCTPWPLSTASHLTRRASHSIPSPVSLTPSQFWDGDDGKWSTYEFEIGTPPQQVRLLPGTSTSTLYWISPLGCSAAANDDSDCVQNRGGTFNSNASSTWAFSGDYQYQAAYTQSTILGYNATAQTGTDTVTLGWSGSPNPPTIQNQFIGGLLEKEIFYVGNFGLYPRPVNISSLSNSQNSTLQNLRAQNAIPSTSWALQAGYHGAQLPNFGSLTLGGYDTTRFRPPPTGFTIPFGPDQTRDLLVPIQGISSPASNSAGGLLPGGPVFAYIDSTIPAIWLPLDACQAFEKAFNLTWYDSENYYLLTDDQHQALLASNPSVTFSIGTTLAGGPTVQITLPYAAFDLQLTSPIASPPTNYFPLQRANESNQIVLGRTFLQQAYVVADYDRNNFTVAQALFPAQNVQPNIIPIYPPGQSPAEMGSQDSGMASQSSGISGGAIAGIVIGIIAVLLIIGLILWFVRRQRKMKEKKAREEKDRQLENAAAGTATEATTLRTQPSLDHRGSSQPPGYQGTYEKAELHGETLPYTPVQSQFTAAKTGTTELPGDDSRVELAEDDARAKKHELDSQQIISEMEAAEAEEKAAKKNTVYEMAG